MLCLSIRLSSEDQNIDSQNLVIEQLDLIMKWITCVIGVQKIHNLIVENENNLLKDADGCEDPSYVDGENLDCENPYWDMIEDLKDV